MIKHKKYRENATINMFFMQTIKRGQIDTTLFIIKNKGHSLLVQIYVDIIYGSTNEFLCKRFEKLMKSKFEISMIGELTFFLGLQIQKTPNEIFINQAKYAKDLIKKFGLENANSFSTPMATKCHLDKDENGKKVDMTPYRDMIGSLLYLTASRPDIMFDVCVCMY